jgi:hypothetical protein
MLVPARRMQKKRNSACEIQVPRCSSARPALPMANTVYKGDVTVCFWRTALIARTAA